VLAIPIFLCLLVGPHARWVKRFLPNTANRVVFVVIIAAVIVALIVQGASGAAHGDGGGYLNLTFGVLCGAALYRFIYEWWLRTQGPAPRNP
jgi:hypothetical protein